jgi:hypothetical protein
MSKTHAFLVFLLLFEMIFFLINNFSFRGLIDTFNFFTPVFYFLAAVIFLDRNSVNQSLIKFFNAVFIIESLIIMVEVFDDFFGFDIHATKFFTWYIQNDNRFEEHIFIFNRFADDLLELIPTALGIHGFPHYTAPIYVVSFAFTLAHAFSGGSTNAGMVKSNMWSATLLLFVGLSCIYMLGVKTHFVTTIIVILILGVFLSRRILLLSFGFLVLATFVTLLIPELLMRFERYIEQVLVGNPREGSRIDVIFNFQEYLSILDLRMMEQVMGLGSFAALHQFGNILFLEQKFLVYILTFGVLPMLTLISFFVVGLADSLRIFRRTQDPASRATAIAAGCSLIIYFLEMGHMGQTFIAPNFPILFIIFGMIAILARDVKRQHQYRANVSYV